MSGLRKTTIVALILITASCVFDERASAQWIAGSYGAGIAPLYHRPGGPGWTPSPVALYDERGKVSGSINPANGRVQGQGFVPPSAAHYGRKNGETVLYVPMNNAGLSGQVFTPRNRQNRRHNWRW